MPTATDVKPPTISYWNDEMSKEERLAARGVAGTEGSEERVRR